MGLFGKLVSFIFQKSIRYGGFSGILEKVKILSASWGKCVAELEVEEVHTNEMGMLHNGMLLTMFDVITSFAMVTHPKYLFRLPPITNSVSLSIDMKYIEEVRKGEKIIMEANTIHCGKTLAFVEAIITNKIDGNIVAKGTQYFFLNTR